jgi:tRNA (guanine10-N2)-dimethyltransferase
MKLLFLLSGEQPTLPFSELSCIGKIDDSAPQVAVVEAERPESVSRLAMCHAVMEYLGDCREDRADILDMVKGLGIEAPGPFAARVKKTAGSLIKETSSELERVIGRNISGKVSLGNPHTEYMAICSGGRCFLGRILLHTDRGSYDERRPGSRTFFHPGVMMPRMARTLVNISLVQPGETLLDPFCGTGGILIEAGLIGAIPFGGDTDPLMIRGTNANAPGAQVFLADAGCLPVKIRIIDSVVTDLPYGQSVSITGNGVESLYIRSLEEINRVLSPGRRAVVVTHRDIRDIASGIMRIVEFHEQRVHKSLTRRVMVLTGK